MTRILLLNQHYRYVISDGNYEEFGRNDENIRKLALGNDYGYL